MNRVGVVLIISASRMIYEAAVLITMASCENVSLNEQERPDRLQRLTIVSCPGRGEQQGANVPQTICMIAKEKTINHFEVRKIVQKKF